MAEQERQKEPTFHPFPRLPLELRRQIFEEALSQPRILTVHEQKSFVSSSPLDLPPLAIKKKSLRPRDARIIDSYEKNSLHPWEARVLKGREQKLSTKRNTPELEFRSYPTACFDHIWREGPNTPPPNRESVYRCRRGLPRFNTRPFLSSALLP